MQVAIAVEGTRGDVFPMLALARRLLAVGHGVRVCAPPDFEVDVLDTGAAFTSLGTSVRPFLDEGARAVHGGGLAMAGEMVRWGRISLDGQFRILPDAVAGSDVLLGAGTIIAGATAAELHGIPYRAVLYTPALLPSSQHTPAALPFQLSAGRANRVLWRLSAAGMNAALRGRIRRARKALGLPPVRDVVRHVLSDRPVVAVDPALARVPDDCPLPWEQIRCLHPHEVGPLPEKIEAFLAEGPPPVYVGFGSMPDPDPAATTRRLVDAIEGLGCRAVLSSGWARLGAGPLPANVLAVGPVDHASLFPRMAVVVHHGGAGTTHTAARAGVPQLVVPHVLDQFYFARRVSELGVGTATVSRGRLDVAQLAGALGALLDNEWVAARARALGQALAADGPIEPDLERLLAG